MANHESNTLDELQLLIGRLDEERLDTLPQDLRVALAIEDSEMQRVFEKGTFLEALCEKTGLQDNSVRISIIRLRDEKEGYLRYIPEESRMVFGPEGRQWLAAKISEVVEES